MATYKEIQNEVKKEHGFVLKTCWIAHILFDYELTTRSAPNRISGTSRANPCPLGKRPMIEQTMRRMNVLPPKNLENK